MLEFYNAVSLITTNTTALQRQNRATATMQQSQLSIVKKTAVQQCTLAVFALCRHLRVPNASCYIAY
jgi:hypothetical protein